MKTIIINFYKKYKNIIQLLLIWFFILTFIAIQADIRLPNSVFSYATIPAIANKPLNVWVAWDSVYYYDIARNGYSNAMAMFFPLYSFLIFLIGGVLKKYILSGLLISWASIFIGLIYFYKLVKLDFDKDVAERSLFYLLIFPTAFFFLAYYTESLFFMLSMMSFYFARTQRWWLAGLFGFFTALTKLIGIALFPVLIFEYLIQRGFDIKKIKLNILSILLVPGGLLTYMIYLYYKFGNPLAFQAAYKLAWRERSILQPNLLITLVNGLKELFFSVVNIFNENVLNHIKEGSVHKFTFVFFTLIAIGLLGIGYQKYKIRTSYILYGVFLIAMPLFSGTFDSMNRYVLVIFPIFIILGLLGRNKLFDRFYILFSFSMLILFLVAFANKYWVG